MMATAASVIGPTIQHPEPTRAMTDGVIPADKFKSKRRLIPLRLQPQLNQPADGFGTNSAEPDSLETIEYPRLREFGKILLKPHDRS
jgi:hypothetical protein